ncbi:iron-containing alcohol dehydrogenase [Mangrovibacterium diazotrophicum]|uniref:Alcohol dehydrogenase class IV n=1 Tax=Mangrovibacterium diazotrophicum TaxID=1261403 RepID=A0A419W4B7_9BACT|nr:iron-containing alcohol dehydrogenase [Mangrovibacterium diazotrophicum]RKD90295.1 alcohol dehydrogenase class IV [Mangrovibacterium diazotrophicum]
MELIKLNTPSQLVIGDGSLAQFFEDFVKKGYQRLFVLSIPVVRPLLQAYFDQLGQAGILVQVNEQIAAEPSFAEVEGILAEAREFKTDAVAGIGGGSVLDAAKFIAAQLENTQTTSEIIGIGNLKGRSTYLACLPTTAGTGSEVSPNAIFLDTTDNEKKGVISPFLMPDAAYIDPLLTVGVPPAVTAFTGIDAFTHCLEAFINRFAHPVIDRFALDGMQLIFKNLKKAYDQGDDLEARAAVALGSVYGGMCLGPVNTAAVHALAYPLGSKYKIAHGLSNAVMLPYVLEYNLPAATERFAIIAKTIGVEACSSDEEYAAKGIEAIKNWIVDLNIPLKLSALEIPEAALEDIATSALKVQRLLRNNVREISFDDALEIYRKAY